MIIIEIEMSIVWTVATIVSHEQPISSCWPSVAAVSTAWKRSNTNWTCTWACAQPFRSSSAAGILANRCCEKRSVRGNNILLILIFIHFHHVHIKEVSCRCWNTISCARRWSSCARVPTTLNGTATKTWRKPISWSEKWWASSTKTCSSREPSSFSISKASRSTTWTNAVCRCSRNTCATLK